MCFKCVQTLSRLALDQIEEHILMGCKQLPLFLAWMTPPIIGCFKITIDVSQQAQPRLAIYRAGQEVRGKVPRETTAYALAVCRPYDGEEFLYLFSAHRRDDAGFLGRSRLGRMPNGMFVADQFSDPLDQSICPSDLRGLRSFWRGLRSKKGMEP